MCTRHSVYLFGRPSPWEWGADGNCVRVRPTDWMTLWRYRLRFTYEESHPSLVMSLPISITVQTVNQQRVILQTCRHRPEDRICLCKMGGTTHSWAQKITSDSAEDEGASGDEITTIQWMHVFIQMRYPIAFSSSGFLFLFGARRNVIRLFKTTDWDRASRLEIAFCLAALRSFP